mgnify:CR=1 FL=1
MRSTAVLLGVIAALIVLAVGAIWLLQSRARSEHPERSVGTSANWFSVGVFQAAYWIEEGLQDLEQEDTTSAAGKLVEAEVSLQQAFTAAAIYGAALGEGYSFPLGIPVNIYASEIKQVRLRLARGNVLAPQRSQLLDDTGHDLRIIYEALPEELLRKADRAETERAVAGLKEELRVDSVRGWLGDDTR